MVKFESDDSNHLLTHGDHNGSSYHKIKSKVSSSVREKMLAVEEEIECQSDADEDRACVMPKETVGASTPLCVVTTADLAENGSGEEQSSTHRTINQNGVTALASPVHGEQSSSSLLLVTDEGVNSRGRTRSSAFIDPKTKEERPIYISEKLGIIDDANTKLKSLTKKRDSLTYSSCWDDTVEKESDEMWRTCNIVTETIAYILWRSADTHSDRPPWKVC